MRSASSTEAALQSALTASRARIRALESQVALSGASEDQIRRGAAALTTSTEVAALKAERDAMQVSLAAAEKKLMLQERQQHNERERRAALAKQLKRKDAALSRKEAERVTTVAAEQAAEQASAAAAQAAQLVEASMLRDAADAQLEMAHKLELQTRPLHLSLDLLARELKKVEDDTAEQAAAQGERYEEALSEALERAVQAELQLAGELLASERTVVGEAHERAESECVARGSRSRREGVGVGESSQKCAFARMQRRLGAERDLAVGEGGGVGDRGGAGSCRRCSGGSSSSGTGSASESRE